MEINELIKDKDLPLAVFKHEARKIIEGMSAQKREEVYRDMTVDIMVDGLWDGQPNYREKCFVEILDEYVDGCALLGIGKGELKEPQKGVEKQRNTVFAIPQYLKIDLMEKILKALERTEGYDGKPVIDRSCTPWVVSSMPDWGHVAKTICRKTGLRVFWDDWGKMIGKDKESLKKAYYKSDKETKSKKRIESVINSII